MITINVEVIRTGAQGTVSPTTEIKRFTRLAACLAAPLLLWQAPLSASAQDLKLAADATFTAVSGYAGENQTIGATDGSRGMSAIEWFEDGDEPCKLVLNTRHLNTNDINQPQVVLKDVYTHVGKQPCSSPGNSKAVRLSGNNNWIYKIQACTTDKSKPADDKLKGMRIWAATVNTRSPIAVSRGSSYQEDKHAHCDKWHTAVSCPVGKIGSRLRVHHNTNKTKIIGLALECRTLSPG